MVELKAASLVQSAPRAKSLILNHWEEDDEWEAKHFLTLALKRTAANNRTLPVFSPVT